MFIFACSVISCVSSVAIAQASNGDRYFAASYVALGTQFGDDGTPFIEHSDNSTFSNSIKNPAIDSVITGFLCRVLLFDNGSFIFAGCQVCKCFEALRKVLWTVKVK